MCPSNEHEDPNAEATSKNWNTHVEEESSGKTFLYFKGRVGKKGNPNFQEHAAQRVGEEQGTELWRKQHPMDNLAEVCFLMD